MRSISWILMLLLACGAAVAQESKEAKTETDDAREWTKAPRLPARVDVVISRIRGEKKTSRTYTIHQFTEEAGTSLRLGAQVPFQTRSEQGPTVVFKDVGVKVSVVSPLRRTPDGRYQCSVQVEDSSVLPLEAGPGPKNASTSPAAAGPVVQSLNVLHKLVLRDGETFPMASGVDPVTGDTVKVEVTFTLVK